VGPAGLAFYVWDHGVKRGDIRVLGAASYASPLLSTLVLVAFGMAQAGWVLGVACLAITAGAVLAARDMLFARRGS
jgi:drug/metabolite transporter (DMT)-like permease